MRRLNWHMTLLLTLLLCVTTAHAATIGVYFDSGGNQTEKEVAAFTPFTFYVVVKGVFGGLLGYEFGVELHEELSLMGHSVFPNGSLALLNGPRDFIVGLPECGFTSGSGVIAQFTAMLSSDMKNLSIRLRAPEDANPSADGPAYESCDHVLYEFDELETAYLNPSKESVGRMKERFDN